MYRTLKLIHDPHVRTLPFAVGNYFGAAALRSSVVKKEYIDRTQRFYAEYGGKTIILARFVPIIRTFAPFVAGVGSMSYSKFGLYNVLGALLWTGVCTGAGFAFGNVPAVHENFSLVVLGIVAVSLLPVLFELLTARNGGGGEAGMAGKSGAVRRQGESLSAGFYQN
jgi:membrane-associated protein